MKRYKGRDPDLKEFFEQRTKKYRQRVVRKRSRHTQEELDELMDDWYFQKEEEKDENIE